MAHVDGWYRPSMIILIILPVLGGAQQALHPARVTRLDGLVEEGTDVRHPERHGEKDGNWWGFLEIIYDLWVLMGEKPRKKMGTSGDIVGYGEIYWGSMER